MQTTTSARPSVASVRVVVEADQDADTSYLDQDESGYEELRASYLAGEF